MVAIVQYSASAEDRDTTDYFFDFQDIGALLEEVKKQFLIFSCLDSQANLNLCKQ